MSWRALRSLPPEATVIRAVVAKQHISRDDQLRIGFFVNKEGLSGDLEKFRSFEQVLRFRSRGGDQVSVARFGMRGRSGSRSGGRQPPLPGYRNSVAVNLPPWVGAIEDSGLGLKETQTPIAST